MKKKYPLMFNFSDLSFLIVYLLEEFALTAEDVLTNLTGKCSGLT